MKIIPLTHQILIEILKKEQTFLSSTRKNFKKYQITKQNRSDAIITIGSELRHHLLLSKYIDFNFGELSLEISSTIALCIANKIFAKKFQNEQAEKFLKENISSLDIMKQEDIISKYHDINETKDLYNFGELTNLQNLCLRFNVPYWVGKMWFNHYGSNVGFKQLKVSHAPHVFFASFYDKNQEVDTSIFEVTSIENVYKYIGKEPIKNLAAYKEGKMYFPKPVFSYIFANLQIEPIKGIAVYSNYSNSLLNELFLNFGSSVKVEYITNGVKNLTEIKSFINEKNMNRVNVYDCSFSAITTCISSEVNTFFICPKGSELDNLHLLPDYFLRADNNDLDNLISEEKVALEKSANLLDISGRIIYVVPTADKKESRSVIEEFLKNHPDFSLINERQYFFFDEFDCSYYFAILEKGIQND